MKGSWIVYILPARSTQNGGTGRTGRNERKDSRNQWNGGTERKGSRSQQNGGTKRKRAYSVIDNKENEDCVQETHLVFLRPAPDVPGYSGSEKK